MKKKLFISMVFLVLVALACSAPFGSAAPTPTAVPAAIQTAPAAATQAAAPQAAATQAPVPTVAPTGTPVPTATPAVAAAVLPEGFCEGTAPLPFGNGDSSNPFINGYWQLPEEPCSKGAFTLAEPWGPAKDAISGETFVFPTMAELKNYCLEKGYIGGSVWIYIQAPK